MKKKATEQLIFPVIVLVLSFMTILRNFHEFYWTSIFVALIGITAGVLFFLDNKRTSFLFYIWIISQLVTYSTNSFTYFTDQFPNLSIGLKFHGRESFFAINLAPLFYFIGYRLLKMFDLIGKKVSVKPIKADSKLKAVDGKITEIVNMNKDGKWFRVEFSENENSESNTILIKPKGEERFSRKSSILALVKEGDGTNSFIDWGKVKLN